MLNTLTRFLLCCKNTSSMQNYVNVHSLKIKLLFWDMILTMKVCTLMQIRLLQCQLGILLRMQRMYNALLVLHSTLGSILKTFPKLHYHSLTLVRKIRSFYGQLIVTKHFKPLSKDLPVHLYSVYTTLILVLHWNYTQMLLRPHFLVSYTRNHMANYDL